MIAMPDIDTPLANAYLDLIEVLDRAKVIDQAQVSGVYRTGEWWRVTVAVNLMYVLAPRFRREADAEAFRVAAGEALDRAI